MFNLFNVVSATSSTTSIVGDVVIQDFDVLVRTQFYFAGFVIFLLIVMILWRK